MDFIESKLCKMIILLNCYICIHFQELDSTDDVSGWRTLSTAGILNLTMLLMQSVLSWISR